jgi:thiol-disulfide isomerase/thioredoxin
MVTMFKSSTNAPVETFEHEVENVPQSNNTDINNKIEVLCYYANWCGHSRSFLPKWDEFKKYAGNKYPQVKVTTILCEGDNEEKMCRKPDVAGYPTVILQMENGERKSYNGNRTVNDLATWVENNLT